MSTRTGAHLRSRQTAARGHWGSLAPCRRAVNTPPDWLRLPTTAWETGRECRCCRTPGLRTGRRRRGRATECFCVATVIRRGKDFTDEHVGCPYSAVGGVAVGVWCQGGVDAVDDRSGR